jgi:hypothetical protein
VDLNLKTFFCQVTIRGPGEDVEKAIKLLKELSNEKQLSGHSIEVTLTLT